MPEKENIDTEDMLGSNP